MKKIILVKHAPGAPGLRWFGLGPNFWPSRGLLKLQRLLDKHAFWAKGRSDKEIRQMLAGSKVIISLWRGKRLVGFGRATSDCIYRAVLWDVVVAGDLQGVGLGRKVVEALLSSSEIQSTQKVYLMTTNSLDFYNQLGFKVEEKQKLLLIEK